MFTSFLPIDRTLSGTTTTGQSGPGSDDSEGVLCIPQISSITGISASDCLISYLWHSLWGVFLPCRDSVGVFYSSIRLGHRTLVEGVLLLCRCYITWIFGSFQVTQCALTSCHVVISKQDCTTRELRSNRCVTGRRWHDENHAVRFRQSAENCSRARDTQPIRGVLACKWVQALAPPGSWKKIWEEVLSLSICLSIHLSHTTETSTFSRIKCERFIFIKKCIRSCIEVRHYLWLCSAYICICMWVYNTEMQSVYSIAPSD